MKIAFFVLFFSFVAQAFAATSQENRAQKKWEITAQTGADYRFYTTSYMLAYHLKPDDVLGLKLSHGRSEDDQQQTAVALQYKHFTGNSFYVAGELFYLNTYEDTDWIIFNQNINSRWISMGANIRIGNQWTWEHFTIGCDWVGIGRRFINFEQGDLDQAPYTGTLLNLYVGVRF